MFFLLFFFSKLSEISELFEYPYLLICYHCQHTSDKLKPIWNENYKEAYIENIDLNAIANVENDLKQLLETPNAILPEQIDEITTKVNNIMVNSANIIGLIKHVRQKQKPKVIRKGKMQQPWFNKTCKEERTNFLRAKAKAKKNKTAATFKLKQEAFKKYQQTIKKKFLKIIKESL